jgi:hypothetical protein
MKISPNYKVSHFIKADEDKDWKKLVEIFSDRLNGRYLKPIELILNSDCEISEFSGFSIMALDCILIETLTQFENGHNETPRSEVGASFKEFLTQHASFKDHFIDGSDVIFYNHFRNGLLHQAQTKNKSLIKIGQRKMVVKIEDGLIIDRERFHDALVSEINCYKQKLLSSDAVLREKFIKKMKFICNIP